MKQPFEPSALSSWKDFLTVVSSLFEERDDRLKRHEEAFQEVEHSKAQIGETNDIAVRKFIENAPGTHFLFRGHRSGKWTLDTTLERAYPNIEFSLYDVFDLSQRTWNQMVLGDLLDDVNDAEFPKQSADIAQWCATKPWVTPYLKALTTFRHMGVPSPLLDWTHSPFVAAYFAFCDADEKDSDPVAVYCFQEATGPIRRYNYQGTGLKALGPFGHSHERHIRQQGAYTFCIKGEAISKNSVSICNHELYFENVREDGQDFGRLSKFTIPASEKGSAMRDLERMNITEASLFETQDALARTLFRRTIRWFDDQ